MLNKEQAMLPDARQAEAALRWAGEQNPGAWVDHSRYVAQACRNIARRCKGMDENRAYILGLLHDIGRYAGVTSEKHLLDGYRYCESRGWPEAARICMSHAFIIQDIHTSIGEFDVTKEDYQFMAEYIENAQYNDYDRLVQVGDSLALPQGFCFLEKRFVDVAIRYGVCDVTVPRWKKTLELKEYFEEKAGCNIYELLPGIMENSLNTSVLKKSSHS